MPVVRVANVDLESEVARLEATGRVVSIERDGDGAFVVLYESRRVAPGEVETR